jgi:hypothetical protein
MRFNVSAMAGNIAGINFPKALPVLLNLRALLEKGSQIISIFYEIEVNLSSNI